MTRKTSMARNAAALLGLMFSFSATSTAALAADHLRGPSLTHEQTCNRGDFLEFRWVSSDSGQLQSKCFADAGEMRVTFYAWYFNSGNNAGWIRTANGNTIAFGKFEKHPVVNDVTFIHID